MHHVSPHQYAADGGDGEADGRGEARGRRSIRTGETRARYHVVTDTIPLRANEVLRLEHAKSDALPAIAAVRHQEANSHGARNERLYDSATARACWSTSRTASETGYSTRPGRTLRRSGVPPLPAGVAEVAPRSAPIRAKRQRVRRLKPGHQAVSVRLQGFGAGDGARLSASRPLRARFGPWLTRPFVAQRRCVGGVAGRLATQVRGGVLGHRSGGGFAAGTMTSRGGEQRRGRSPGSSGTVDISGAARELARVEARARQSGDGRPAATACGRASTLGAPASARERVAGHVGRRRCGGRELA
jgi:hypothetical protein